MALRQVQRGFPRSPHELFSWIWSLCQYPNRRSSSIISFSGSLFDPQSMDGHQCSMLQSSWDNIQLINRHNKGLQKWRTKENAKFLQYPQTKLKGKKVVQGRLNEKLLLHETILQINSNYQRIHPEKSFQTNISAFFFKIRRRDILKRNGDRRSQARMIIIHFLNNILLFWSRVCLSIILQPGQLIPRCPQLKKPSLGNHRIC